MINNVFNKTNKMGIADWGVIYFGCRGLPIGKLSCTTLSDYSCDRLMLIDNSDSLFPLVAELSYCTEITNETLYLLDQVCQISEVDLYLAKKKWKLFCLESTLDSLPEDYMYALLALNEFWVGWGEEKNSQNIIQGVGDAISPDVYYSDENLKMVMSSHREWLSKEMASLISKTAGPISKA